MTLWDPMNCSTLGFRVLHISLSLLRLIYLESCDTIQPSHLLLSSSLPSCFPCIKVFSFQSTLFIRCPKYWNFCSRSFSECSGLISFRIDFFDLLAIQWTLKSLLQHFQWKPSTLQRPAFFMVPTVTSIRDYWNNWIFDYTDLCQQNGSSAF